MIAVIAVQRWFFKLLIAVFLTREYKHDQTNKAWWTGSLVQLKSSLFREYVVKVRLLEYFGGCGSFGLQIVETSLFAADFLTIHALLFLVSLPILIPYIDRAHATMLSVISMPPSDPANLPA
jgi:1,3-beta-glucan synthase